MEADKIFMGGHDKQGQDDKAIVLGMIERQGEVVDPHVMRPAAISIVSRTS